MLAHISGKILHLDFTHVIVQTSSGLGYELVINELVYSKILDMSEVSLFVYHSISENGQSLFGFLDIEERNVFKELIKISGVGGRVAQMILSLWVARLKSAIANDDKKTLESVKWVGKKMAEKIILEFHDKDWVLTSSDDTSWSISKNISSNIPSDLESQILSTLTLMWYNLQKVQEILKEVPEELSTLEQILPYVIKKM